MRILAIRGENLASLAGRFEIDLAAEPLAGVGLFAITGETGAGKSTILDALCLALYGEYPRVRVGRRESVPDPSGEALSAEDSRAILRRGAASGFAEVDFIARDGAAYRARWEARRARGRAAGRLQPEERLLTRLSDGAAVAAGKQNVLHAVKDLTDLTFDQFRRTVLLAQGEFDAFLLAGEGERAELLEKITGTEIYAALSMKVREGTEARRRAAEELERRRADIGLLDDAARVALAAEQAEIAGAAGEKARARDTASDRLKQGERIAGARSDLAAAEIALADAEAADLLAASERASWAELEAAEPLRVSRSAAEAAARVLAQAQEKVSAAEAALATARAAAEGADAAFGAAREADGAVDAKVAGFLPLWQAAEGLDGEIAAALDEASRAAADAERLAGAATDRAVDLDQLTHAIAAARAGLDAAEAGLAERSAWAPLAERIDAATDAIAERARLGAEAAAAGAAARAAQEEAGRIRAGLDELDREAGTLRGRRADIAAHRARWRDRLAVLDDAGLAARDAALGRLLERLREAVADAQRHARAEALAASAQARAASAADDAADARAKMEAAEAARLRLAAARTEVAALADLADGTASAEAVRLRSLLVEGEPCPVCGGREHPHRAHPDALDALVARVRGRRDALDADLAAADEAATREAARHAVAEVQGAEAVAAVRAGREEAAALADAYGAARPDLAAACAALGFAGPPATLAGAGTALTGLGVAAKAARQALSDGLAEAAKVRADLDRSTQEDERLGARLDAIADQAGRARADRHAQDLAAARETQAARDLAARAAALGRDLLPFLAAAGLGAKDLEDESLEDEALAGRLSAAADAFIRLRDGARRHDGDLRALEPKRAAAVTADETARAAAGEAAGRLAARNGVLDDKRAARAGMLDGEPTAGHRGRILEERRLAQAALDAARARQAAAAGDLRAAEAGRASTGEAAAAARVAAMGAGHAFAAACEAAGLALERAGTLLAVPAAERAALKARLDGLDRARAEALQARATRQGDLDRLLEGVDTAFDPEALAAEVNTLEAEIAGLHARSGAIAADLARDDAARATADTLSGEIAAARAELEVWRAVDEAIGSATGDRFRRFVQGITLDHLVRLANSHLEALSPRYRLARGAAADLVLHVVDRDMGEEQRATRSLSGGERFLVSLALALALSGLEGRGAFVDTLFIDEGFGSLDGETLDMAVDALEALQGRGRKVGVITHVAAMMERIAVQVRVEKRGGGRSQVRVTAAGVSG